MSTFYRKTRQYIFSAYSIESLNEIRRNVDDAYNVGKLTDKEYGKLIKLMDYIVEKGVKCIMVGL